MSGTQLNSTQTIYQTDIDGYSWPVTIAGDGTIITLGEDITLTSADKYFIFTDNNQSIRGGKIVTIDGALNYPGFVKNANTLTGCLIQDINIAAINGSTLNVGAGWVVGSDSFISVTNCTSDGLISKLYSGGISGRYCYGNITNCKTTGNISGSMSGGIIGECYIGYTVSFCVTTGLIGSTSWSGGIVAINSGTISNCISYGDINKTIQQYTGGIVGNINTGIIQFCHSYGNISASGTTYGAAGGILGYDNTNGTIRNCSSHGTIINTNTTTDNRGCGVGGILGSEGSNSNTLGTISNCYSFGAVTNPALTYSTAGPIIGFIKTSDTSTNCYGANGTWSDSTANSNLTGITDNSIWVSPGTNLPYLLMSFNQYSYDPNTKTISSVQTDTSQLLSSTEYTYSIISESVDSITINAATSRLTFTNVPIGVYTIHVLSSKSQSIYNIATYTFTSFVLICFLKGTNILTNKGEVRIENLKEHQTIRTNDGRDVEILEIKKTVSKKQDLIDMNNEPILIQKDFFQANIPNQDLYLSKFHCVKIPNTPKGKCWFKVGQLISFLKSEPLENITDEQVTYYNLLLPDYYNDIIIANGVECDSLHFTNQDITLQNMCFI
jgi:hypothetical protein